jgi:probable F420-dependent oxidoreductase
VSVAARPFRFGVEGANVTDSAAELLELAQRAEGFGYSTLLVGDHVVEYYTPSIVGLAWVAAQTEKLRFGTLVLGNDYRHPAILAKDAATLDKVSGGRFELGLGAGWLQGDYDAIGIPFDEPRVRVDRLAEALTVVKGCWAGESFDFSGEHYTIRDYAARPRPVQKPRLPIIIGGGSPRVLRLAGAEADIVGIHPNTKKSDVVTDTQDERMRRKIAWVREGAGERFDELELMTMCRVVIADDAEAAAAPIAAETGTTVAEILSSALFLIGTVEEICATLRRRREEWGTSYIVVQVSAYEAFAPVVEQLAGT